MIISYIAVVILQLKKWMTELHELEFHKNHLTSAHLYTTAYMFTTTSLFSGIYVQYICNTSTLTKQSSPQTRSLGNV